MKRVNVGGGGNSEGVRQGWGQFGNGVYIGQVANTRQEQIKRER